VERWRLSRAATAFVLGLLTVVQFNQQAATAVTVARQGEPYRKIRAATAKVPNGIVFLHDSPGFVAKHFHLNQTDWRHSSHIFLVDADPGARNEWTCRYETSTWTVAEYDPKTHSAVLDIESANCGATTPLPQDAATPLR